jgi:hypothetical protein
MQFLRSFFTLFVMLLSVILFTIIAAIFYEVAVIALLQLDVINFCGAAIGTKLTKIIIFVCLGLGLIATHFEGNSSLYDLFDCCYYYLYQSSILSLLTALDNHDKAKQRKVVVEVQSLFVIALM